ncbi:cupin-like domain-containing protein [Gynurincola endophyticus]|uniref:cupin-like domain-containing protein n=1 Tax=Gynurincola endophyticus TaxID=2479004 RepID=UPI000F8F54E4|nr:cupin-like domain-containing protein [Gynurincola endophyticus]
MRLISVDTVDQIQPNQFKENYYSKGLPLVIKDLAKSWPAYKKWNWDYFKEAVGPQKVGIYNNVKSDAFTPVNTADEYTLFTDYIDKIKAGPAPWRIFLFNIFDHAPELSKDFIWPDHLMKGFVKRYPMLFTGGAGSITHMHFDIDLSHILHTQFLGRKRVLLFPFEEQHKLYRKPFEVLSLADFSNYHDIQLSKLDTAKFPATLAANGYEVILEPGDTLFMPAGYWHHMEYIDSGVAMSLRALQDSWTGKLNGAWNLFGMRSIDTLMKKTAPHWWFNYKIKKLYVSANKHISMETIRN